MLSFSLFFSLSQLQMHIFLTNMYQYVDFYQSYYQHGIQREPYLKTNVIISLKYTKIFQQDRAYMVKKT